MFNAQQLLGHLMGSDMAKSAKDRIGHAMGPQGTGGAGGLLDSLSSMAGDAYGHTKSGVQSGNPLAVGGLGAIAGALLGGGSSALTGALGGGALALLGTLAYKAMKPEAGGDPQQIAAEAPVGLRQPQNTTEHQQAEHAAMMAVRAMVSAAKADGVIDPHEYQRILGHLEQAGADDKARAFVEDEMRKPLDMDSLVNDVAGQEEAVQVYAASLLAIEVDTDVERQYLETLAHRLNLTPDVVDRLHQTLNVAR